MEVAAWERDSAVAMFCWSAGPKDIQTLIHADRDGHRNNISHLRELTKQDKRSSVQGNDVVDKDRVRSEESQGVDIKDG